jgi:hypothetical protein
VKLDALEHPKLHHLTERLNVKRTTAIGHLELLWAFASKHAAQGDIGKWPNGAIARACDWEGDAEAYIDALVESRFVDRDDEHRLVIHDWQDHAQGWVRAKLKKLHLDFISTSEQSSESSSDGSSDETNDDSNEPSPRARVPSLAKPREAPSKNPQPPLKGADVAQSRSERKPRSITDASLDAWNRTLEAIDTVRGDKSKTWADADASLNDELAIQAIRTTGGHKLIGDRTQFTQANLKRLFRESYESNLQNPKEKEGPNGHTADQNPAKPELSALLSQAAKGMAQ